MMIPTLKFKHIYSIKKHIIITDRSIHVAEYIPGVKKWITIYYDYDCNNKTVYAYLYLMHNINTDTYKIMGYGGVGDNDEFGDIHEMLNYRMMWVFKIGCKELIKI